MLAGILAAVMVLASAPLSGSVSYAEELPQSAQENMADEESAAQEAVSQNEPGENQDGESEQVSANTLMSVGEPEVREEAEIDGAYQFGGAPSADGGSLGIYSESAYTDDEILDYLYQQIMDRSPQINISQYQIKKGDIANIVSGVMNEHPDLYFVGRRYSTSSYSGSEYVNALIFTYSDAYDDALFQSETQKALAAAAGCTSDLQKAIALHEYLTVNCEYDYENYLAEIIPDESYNAYGVFVKRIAVCQGYALAYKYLLNRLGIDCYMVTSDAMNHAWNLIKLDGQYYQVDVTWDDPTWDRVGRSVHTYMFCSDGVFQDAEHKHRDWSVTYGSQTVNYQATDTRYDNAFWTDCTSPLVLSGNDCYYISCDGGAGGKPALMKTGLNAITADGSVLQEIDYWTAWGGGGYWPGAYSGLFRIGDRLYYNDKTKIYSVALNGTDKQTAFTADTTEGYIYGSAYCQGKVLYVLHQTPNVEGKETVLTADIDVGGGPEPSPGDESQAVVKAPDTTTYKVGQKLDLNGGTVTYPSGSTTKTDALAENMVSGFDSSRPGICQVKVTVGEYTAGFDTLIVEEPKLTASVGKRLSEIPLPENAYGDYAWQDGTQKLEKPDVYTFTAVFTPKDETKFQKLTDIQVEVTAQAALGSDTDVTFKADSFPYNGTEQEPKPVVRQADVVLIEGQDYELSYENNKNAGEATVIISGMGGYSGSITKTFEITPVELLIAAQDKTILIGAPLPQAGDFAYEVSGLLAGDALVKEPVLSCGITDTKKAGRYEIIPSGADGGPNYVIPAANYRSGILTVAEETVSCTVTFDVQGHGTAPAAQVGVKVGSLIAKPDDPTAAGYRFDGWYREAACTKVWNFDTDIVQADMTLYAKWVREGGDGSFALQEIGDMYYTGKACKPAVSVYDGDMLLKSGRDYQIKYFNNINANKDGVLKKGNGEGADFNAELPYVEIIGKGNYTDRIKNGNKDTVKVNFNILRASIGDGTDESAKGVTLKITDQLVAAKKVQKPFSSIKYGRAMKRDTDFAVSLTVVNAHDEAGGSLNRGLKLENAELPREYAGEFLLTVVGKGNYTGSIQKTVYVTDKTHLMKNTVITIGKDIKNVEFTGNAVQLKAAEENAADVFTVKSGKTFLKPGRDYTVSYRNNDRAGKAELLITGNGEYVGTKAAAFQIRGKAFSARTVRVEGITPLEYTGRALTQNDVRLVWYAKDQADVPLDYGKHYTISYANNINKGTATMTFRGVEQNGYSGSFKMTFKITAVDIADPSKVARTAAMGNMSFSYCKAGVKPVEEIRLTNKAGIVLKNGKDYTLKYTNNKAVADAQAAAPPTVTIQGKGNYSGRFDIPFQITKCSLKQTVDAGGIQVKTTATVFQPGKADDYLYKPAVKLMEGKTALRVNQDYEIQYQKNTQAACIAYLEEYEKQNRSAQNSMAGSAVDKKLQEMMPKAVITAAVDSSYQADGEIVVPLPIYQTKFTAKNLEITVAEMVYTKDQPQVTVSMKGEDGTVVLAPGRDYTVSYGANNKAGKNKGSVTITGLAPKYGGSVTKKFNILSKPISY